MAEMVSGLAGSLQGSVTGLINKGQGWLDRLMPPERRSELAAKASKFATEKPALASFLLSQVALSGLPLGLFIIMTITVIVFSLIAALLIGLIGALLFIVFAVGFALVILLPILFITTFAAAFIWLWGMGAYYILKWFNQKEIPGIHKPLGEGMPNLDALTGTGKPPGDPNGESKEGKGEGKKEMNGHAPEKKGGESKGKSSGVDLPDPKKAADIGQAAGKTGDVNKLKDTAGGATGAASGATSAVGGAKGAVSGATGLG